MKYIISILIILNLSIFIYYNNQIDKINKKHNQQLQQIQLHLYQQKNLIDLQLNNNRLLIISLDKKFKELVFEYLNTKPTYSDSLSQEFILNYMQDYIKRHKYYD